MQQSGWNPIAASVLALAWKIHATVAPLPRDKFFSFPAKKSLAHAATLPFLPDSSGVSRPPSPLCGFGTLLPP